MLKTGLDVLQSQNFAPLAGKRIGLMTNPSAVDADLNSTYQIFRGCAADQSGGVVQP
ncbi:MAG: hypothetical protein HC890_06815 [Chloroflexaceae bacterium]|nr:hypothetical protein [Chloroflexaceae bacterium]